MFGVHVLRLVVHVFVGAMCCVLMCIYVALYIDLYVLCAYVGV